MEYHQFLAFTRNSESSCLPYELGISVRESLDEPR